MPLTQFQNPNILLCPIYWKTIPFFKIILDAEIVYLQFRCTCSAKQEVIKITTYIQNLKDKQKESESIIPKLF